MRETVCVLSPPVRGYALGTQVTAPAEVEYEHVEYALDPADPT